jgi:acetylornithine deacetylase/succinyl-diaminopimelate desuccinylase-like protein
MTQNIHAYIHAQLDHHIEKIRQLVRQPSVSLEKQGMHECAELVRENLAALGCQETVLADMGDGYPGVWGRLDAQAQKTIVYYGYYDVRPTGTEPWQHPPFGAEIAAIPPFPRAIVGRGALQTKGPLQAWLNALEAIQQVEGKLPVNILFLIEGAEILGSPNFLKLASAYQTQLRTADAWLSPGASQNARGEVSVVLGYKGLVYLEIEANGDVWGRGPTGGPVHSATNSVVDSPAWRLVQALASFTDREGLRVVVPGLEQLASERKFQTESEAGLIQQLLDQFGGADWNGVLPGLSPRTPVRSFKHNLAGRALLEEYLYAPSVNISGLRGGYTGPGTKPFLLPHSATAVLDIRTVTEMEAEEIIRLLRQHLDREGFGDIQIRVLSAYSWGQTGVEAAVVQAALKTIAAYARPAVIWPLVPFGGPWAHLPKQMGLPALRGVGLGYGDRAATSDEYFVIQGSGPIPGLAEVESFYVDLLYNYAQLD